MPFNAKNLSIIISTMILAINFFLPVVESSSSLGIVLLFYIKIIPLFLALLVPIYGLGLGYLFLVRTVFTRLLFDEEKVGVSPLIIFLCGILTAGWLCFTIGLILPPQSAVCIAILLLGYVSFLVGVSTVDFSAAKRDYASTPKLAIAFSSLCILVIAAKLFMFQNHEDAYLYHLALSEVWLQQGHTGVVLNNIYSGYCGVVEYFYLLLKIILRGNAEQNALAQLFHAFAGWGTVLYVMHRLAIHLGAPRISWLFLILILMQAKFSHAFFLPKNDGILTAIVAVGFLGLFQRQWLYIFLIAGLTLCTKYTGAIAFVSFAIVILIMPQGACRMNILRRLLFAAAWMICGFAPFGIHNYFATGNPFFPVLNEIFRSPYAPQLIGQIVTEMKPLQIKWLEALQSLLSLLKFHWLIALVFVGALVRKGFKKEYYLPLTIALVQFLLCLILLGPFNVKIENRHFALSLAVLMTLGLGVWLQILTNSRLQKWMISITVTVCLVTSGLDSKLLSLREILQNPNPIASIFDRKPVLALNAWLTDYDDRTDLRILALTTTNTSYFLRHGEFWHHSKTYPLWQWPIEQWDQEYFAQLLQEQKITHILTGDETIPAKIQAVVESLPILRQEKQYTLRSATMTSPL